MLRAEVSLILLTAAVTKSFRQGAGSSSAHVCLQQSCSQSRAIR